MVNDLKNVLNDFRKMKIDYDIERFKLMSYQLENLINDYNKLIKLSKEIQERHMTTIENINRNDIEVRIDYEKWAWEKSNEVKKWETELNELYDIKYEIDNALELLENGEIEKRLIEEEKKLEL